MLQFTAYFFASFAPPYPIFVSVFTLNGMGFGLQDALANVSPLSPSSVIVMHRSTPADYRQWDPAFQTLPLECHSSTPGSEQEQP